MPTQPKSVLESKTMWANSGVVVVTICTFLVNYLTTGSVPDQWLPYVPAIIAVANLVLRLMSTQPVTFTGSR